ncbi:MAG: hypothetical protein HDS43_03195 [Bacteroides sp.]|nr:hypothetical protein [Bacteroides sp.]
MTSREKKDSAIAAAVTFVAALVLLVVLFCCGLRFDRSLLAASSMPEPMETPEEEELFLDPELLDLGEENAVNNDAPAPAFKGEPEPAEEDQPEVVEPGPSPKPTPPVPKPITQKKESPVKATEPSATDKERQKATSSVAKGFAGRNGTPDGKASESVGAGGTGVGISGNARGRTFISCPSPDVALRHKTVVTVNIVVDAAGKVISASATGSASADIRRKCEQAALRARWTEKKGAGETRGTLTFTITPK